jgi:hypothetical protein
LHQPTLWPTSPVCLRLADGQRLDMDRSRFPWRKKHSAEVCRHSDALVVTRSR